MNEAQVLELGGSGCQFVGKAAGQMGQVVFEGAFTKTDFLEHLDAETHSDHCLPNSIFSRMQPRIRPLP